MWGWLGIFFFFVVFLCVGNGKEWVGVEKLSIVYVIELLGFRLGIVDGCKKDRRLIIEKI